ncbi:hypothetical protein G7Y89_g7008 [Cudoniella acicularis]|uniref:Uncharacterized protein n=1 Tax=Cudoniella acicularis TaxID=354080 RepID=A0A8H4W2H1_9HELO|nr:hypothetical protein G7Y89_g7008 [Cudoniella acicularis]
MLRENEDDGETNLTEAFAAIERFDVETGNFPSWISRWGNPSMLKNSSYRLDTGFPDLGWSASRDKLPEVRNVLDLEVLVLKGLKVASISRVFQLHRKSGDSEWLRRIWREVSILINAGPWAETKEFVFLKAIGGAYYREFIENVEAASVDSCKFLLEMTLVGCGIEYDEDGNPGHEFNLGEGLDAYMEPELVETTMETNLDACTILASFIHRYPFSLFITEDKNLGIGARNAKAGDHVCVFYGGKLPFLLRPAGAQWIFMEACYMNDVMHGEAIEELETGKLTPEWFEIR